MWGYVVQDLSFYIGLVSLALAIVALRLGMRAERRAKDEDLKKKVSFRGVRKRLENGDIRIRLTNIGDAATNRVLIRDDGLTQYSYSPSEFALWMAPKASRDLILTPPATGRLKPIEKINLTWKSAPDNKLGGQTVVLEPDLSDD